DEWHRRLANKLRQQGPSDGRKRAWRQVGFDQGVERYLWHADVGGRRRQSHHHVLQLVPGPSRECRLRGRHQSVSDRQWRWLDYIDNRRKRLHHQLRLRSHGPRDRDRLPDRPSRQLEQDLPLLPANLRLRKGYLRWALDADSAHWQ